MATCLWTGGSGIWNNSDTTHWTRDDTSFGYSGGDGRLAIGSTSTAVGQSFTSRGGSLRTARFMITKSGSPTGNVYVKIYAHTGTFGSTSLPTGSAIATSLPINVTTLSTTATWVTFNFSSGSLVNGTKYVLSLEYTGTGGTLLVEYENQDPWDYHPGNGSEKYNGTWRIPTTTADFFHSLTVGNILPGPKDAVRFENATTDFTVTLGNNVAIGAFWLLDHASFDTAGYDMVVDGRPDEDFSWFYISDTARDLWLRNSTITIVDGPFTKYGNTYDNFHAGTSTIIFNCTDFNADITAYGWTDGSGKHGDVFYNVEMHNTRTVITDPMFAGGISGGNLTFNSFIYTATLGQLVQFGGDGVYTFGNFSVIGTPGNKIQLRAYAYPSNFYTLVKTGGGKVNCSYVDIAGATGSPINTWYMGTTSTDGGNNTNIYFYNSWVQTNNDVIHLTDNILKRDISKLIVDNTTLVDSFSRISTHQRTISDIVSLIDGSIRTINFIKSLSDSTILSDVIIKSSTKYLSDTTSLLDSIGKGSTKPNSDTITLSDSISQSVAYVRSISDSVLLSDSILKASSTSRTISDTVTINDSANRVSGKSLSETITLVDNITKDIVKSSTDTITLADSISRSIGYNKTLSDVVTLGDDSSISRAISQTVADVVSLNDGASRQSTYNRVITDTLSLSDGLTYSTSAKWADNIYLSDSVSRIVDYVRLISDSVSLNDNATRSLSIPISSYDNVSLSDSVSQTVNYVRSVTDTVSLADQNSSVSSYTRNISDSVSIIDTISKSITKQVTDTLSVSDSLVKSLSMPISKSDTISLSDNIFISVGMPKGISDSVSLADNSSSISSYQRLLSDNISVSDNTSTIGTTGIILNDNLTLVSEISKSIVKSLSDNVSITDNVETLRTFNRTVSETISLTDEIADILTYTLFDISDTTNLTDSTKIDIVKSIEDAVIITDNLSTVSAFVRTFTDTVSIADNSVKNVFVDGKQKIHIGGGVYKMTQPNMHKIVIGGVWKNVVNEKIVVGGVWKDMRNL